MMSPILLLLQRSIIIYVLILSPGVWLINMTLAYMTLFNSQIEKRFSCILANVGDLEVECW